MKYLLPLYALWLLLSSCSNEDEIISIETTYQVPLEIEVSTGRPIQTRADNNPLAPQEPGTCNVNRVKILVYKASGIVSNTEDDMTLFTFEAIGTTTEQPSSTNSYKAKGYFTASAGDSYRIIALAYLDTDEQYLNVDESAFLGKNYKEATISLKENGGVYKTPEFFKGIIRDETAVIDVVSGSGDLKLKGFLYRAIGRANIEVNNIPDEVTKLEFAVDRYSKENYLFDSVGDMYIGYPVANALLSGERVLAETTIFSTADVTKGRTATLSADMMRLDLGDMGSIYYIKATSNNTTTTYIIMSADQWIYTDYVGILEKVISSNRFKVPTNFQLNVHGDFSALKTGNIVIEYSDEIIDEIKIGILK